MFGVKLKLARKQAGLSLHQLSERMTPRVSAQALSKYETGQMLPSSAVLVGLGKALNASLDFLMSSQVQQLAGLEFRKSSKATAKARTHAEAEAIKQLENLLRIEAILELPSHADPLANMRNSAIATMADAESKAQTLRDAWLLGHSPIVSMTDLLEEKGIRVLQAQLPASTDGLACTAVGADGQSKALAIVIRKDASTERKRFTLAHELAHHALGGAHPNSAPLEKLMNRFAAAFLMPAAHLRAEVGVNRHALSRPEILHLKRIYGVSAAALLLRIRDLQLVPKAHIQRIFRTFGADWRRNEPEPMGTSQIAGMLEQPVRYEQLVYRALAEDSISSVHAADMLGVSLQEIESTMRGTRAA